MFGGGLFARRSLQLFGHSATTTLALIMNLVATFFPLGIILNGFTRANILLLSSSGQTLASREALR
jgi:hypothetical protein